MGVIKCLRLREIDLNVICFKRVLRYIIKLKEETVGINMLYSRHTDNLLVVIFINTLYFQNAEFKNALTLRCQDIILCQCVSKI